MTVYANKDAAVQALIQNYDNGTIKSINDLKSFLAQVSGDVINTDGSSSSSERLLWSGFMSPDGKGSTTSLAMEYARQSNATTIFASEVGKFVNSDAFYSRLTSKIIF